MRCLAPVLALFAAAAVAAPTALAADPPAVQTGAAVAVGQTQATLTASVAPPASATTARFELGTSTSYGLESASRDVGAGSGAVDVSIPVQGLTPSTTYHVRVVATSAAGTVRGGDVTFRTAAVPSRPSASTGAARAVTPTGATFIGTVRPRGAATTYRFEYGLTKTYGSVAGVGDAGGGSGSVGVSVRAEGLSPKTRYHYRLVATNAAGTAYGGDRSFVTGDTPTAATLTADSVRVDYGRPLVLTGRLSGSRTSRVLVQLLTRPFPFTTDFVAAGRPLLSSSKGTYRFTIASLTQSVRAIVVADGALPVFSRPVDVFSVARVGVTSVRRDGRGRVRIGGRVRPGTEHGTVSLQRRSTTGRWVRIARARLRADGRYAVTVRRRARTMTVRVAAVPNDGGAHAIGRSRMLKVGGR